MLQTHQADAPLPLAVWLLLQVAKVDEPIPVWVWIVLILALVAAALWIWWTVSKAHKVAVVKKTGAPDAAPPYRNAGIPFSFFRGIGFLKGLAAGRDPYQIPWILMLGGYQSGNSIALANAGESEPLDGQGGPAFGLAQGLEWWFYTRGLVLNPPSDMVLRKDGRTSDETGFDLFLNWLLRKRPRRPLDGVVLTISADDLMNQTGRAELIVKASVLRHKLSLILHRTSLRLPVYVLVTKCDYVPGFSAFAAELWDAHDDMFGWSNPYPLDSSFSPEWVTQGFAEMGARLAEQRMDIFVESAPVQDPDGVFLFPGEFQQLCEPLRLFLTQTLQDNAYEEGCFFRGFYFCGDATPAPVSADAGEVVDVVAAEAEPEPGSPSTGLSILRGASRASASNNKKPVFLYDLFAAKVFPESRLARPLSRIDMSRNRTVRTAAALTAAFVFVAGIGLLVGGLRLHWFGDQVGKMLNSLLTDMQEAAHHRHRAAESDADRRARESSVSDAAGMVLSNMAVLSERRFGSVFIPASWNGSFNHKLETGMSKAFQDIVLQAFSVELRERLNDIVTAPTPPPAKEDEGPAFDTPEKVPHYPAWIKYVEDLKQLETNADRYNRIAKPGFGSPDDFRELVGYLKFSNSLPRDFDFSNPYFKQVLNDAHNTEFNYEDPRPVDWRAKAGDRANKLIGGFFESWYGHRNRIAIEVNNVAADVDSLLSRIEYSELSALSSDIGSAADDLQSQEFQWVSEKEVPRELVAVFTGPLASVKLLQNMNARDVEGPAAQEFHAFRETLKTSKARITGPILNMNVTPVELSSSVTTLRENLSYLLSQTFASRTPGLPMQTAANPYLWDRASLLEAQQLFDAYGRFERGSLRSMPSYMSSVVKRVAQERLEANVLDLVGQAQSGLAPPGDIDQELKDFAQCVDLFDPLLAGFDKFQNRQWHRRFSALLEDQAKRLLDALYKDVETGNPYGVRDGGFDWWEGQKPLAPAAYELRTADDVKDHLDQTRDRLSAIADKAEPLLKFLEPKLVSSAATPQSVIHLRPLIGELKHYREKRPGNSVTLLEDFIQTGLEKISPDGTCQDPSRDPVGRSDLFIEQRRTLRTKALERCRVLSRRAYTRHIAEPFTKNLAGRFPFGPWDSPELDPKALKEFMDDQHEQYGKYGKTASDILKQTGPDGAPALAFLGQVEKIREVFAPFLAGYEKDPVPSFDFAVAFRVNPDRAVDIHEVAEWGMVVGQQSFTYTGKVTTGHWRLGDPIQVTLRFAKDSPVIPLADPLNQPGMLVSGRTVLFQFDGAWSLFRLLLAHRANRGELDMASQKPHLLSFYIPTVPDPNNPQHKDMPQAAVVRAYVQLTVIPPGAKEGTLVPLPFPDSAPRIAENE